MYGDLFSPGPLTSVILVVATYFVGFIYLVSLRCRGDVTPEILENLILKVDVGAFIFSYGFEFIQVCGSW